MSTESRGERSLAHRRVRLRHVVMAVAALAALLVALLLYDYVSVNLWIERDAGQLEGYPIRLIDNHKVLASSSAGAMRQLDRLLIDEMCRGRRNVVTMSRSEVKYRLIPGRAVVKVYLETAAPEEPSRRSRLKIVCLLKRVGGNWKLASPPVEKTLE